MIVDDDPPTFYRYEQRPEEDVALVLWWGAMTASGELEMTFGLQSKSLSRFLELLGRAHDGTRGFYYTLDAAGRIACAFLVVPTMTNCAFLTLWLAPAWRRLRKGVVATQAAYDLALAYFPVLLGVTRQPRLVATHVRWGYRLLGRLPGVFDGHDGWVVSLTREDYETAKAAGRPRHPIAKELVEWVRLAAPARSTI